MSSDEHFNVLVWWKKNSNAYPILSLMAIDFLFIPVSTVSSESAFSVAFSDADICLFYFLTSYGDI